MTILYSLQSQQGISYRYYITMTRAVVSTRSTGAVAPDLFEVLLNKKIFFWVIKLSSKLRIFFRPSTFKILTTALVILEALKS